MPADSPPRAPDMRRRPRLKPRQFVTLAFLGGVVVAALAGLFGETWATVDAETPGLAVIMTYPERFRYKQINQILVRVENRGATPIDTVHVAFDPEYMIEFSGLLFIPSATTTFRVPLTDLRPGATDLVLVKIQAEEYGRHRGTVGVWTTAGDSLALPISTFVFP